MWAWSLSDRRGGRGKDVVWLLVDIIFLPVGLWIFVFRMAHSNDLHLIRQGTRANKVKRVYFDFRLTLRQQIAWFWIKGACRSAWFHNYISRWKQMSRLKSLFRACIPSTADIQGSFVYSRVINVISEVHLIALFSLWVTDATGLYGWVSAPLYPPVAY